MTENVIELITNSLTCGDPKSFVRGVPTLTHFLVDEGMEDPNTTIC